MLKGYFLIDVLGSDQDLVLSGLAVKIKTDFQFVRAVSLVVDVEGAGAMGRPLLVVKFEVKDLAGAEALKEALGKFGKVLEPITGS